MKELGLPDTVTSNGYTAFYNCVSLKSIAIPKYVSELKDKTFQYCANLTSISLPDSITSIGEMAFPRDWLDKADPAQGTKNDWKTSIL